MDFDKFKQMRPEDQMMAVAKSMAKIEDGTSKSAIAMALYGKSGAQMLPFLHDLAEIGDLQAKMTTEQAAAAANLDDNLKRLTTSGDAWKKELANGMIPALDLGAQALLDVMNGSGGLRDEVKRLVADGSVREWTKQAITGLSYVADAAQYAWRALQSIGKGMGGLAAGLVMALQGNFRGAWKALQESGQDMIDVFGGETLGSRLRARMQEIESLGQKSEETKRKSDFTNVLAKNKKAAAEAKDPFDALLDSIVKTTAGYQAEAAAGEKLTEGQKKAVEVLDQLRTGKVKVSEAQSIQIGVAIEAMLVAEKENREREKALKHANEAIEARRKEAEGIHAWIRAQEEAAAASLKSVKDRVQGLVDEAQASDVAARINVTLAEAVEMVAIARLREKQAGFYDGSEGWKALQIEIEERQRLLALVTGKAIREQQSQAWTGFFQSIDSTAHDVWVNIFDGGSNVFKKLGQVLKASVLDVLYQMVVRKWIIQIGTSFFGSGFGAAAQAASGGSNILGTVSNGSSLLSMGGMATDFMAGFSGASLAPGLMGPTTAGAGGMMGLGNMLASIPGWGWALGGLALLGSLFKDDSGTLHTGSMAQYSAAGGLQNSVERGDFGINIGMVRGANTEKYVSDLSKGLVNTFDSMARAFGGKGGFEVATGFADDTSKDGAWGALRISRNGKDIVNWNDQQTGRWAAREFADGEAGKRQFAEAIARSARDALVVAVGDVKWAQDALAALGDTFTTEQLDAVVKQIAQVKMAFDAMGNQMTWFAGMTDDARTALLNFSGGIDALVANAGAYYQNFYSPKEQREATRRAMQAQLDTLGMDLRLPDIDASNAREQFRALVESQDRSTEAGQRAIAMLMQLSGSFASVTISGEEAGQAAARAQQEQIEAAQRAADEAARAAARAQEQMLAAQREALQQQMNLIQESLGHLQGVFDLVSSSARELLGQVSSTAAMQAAQGRSFIAQSLANLKTSGYLPDVGQLGDAIRAVRGGIDSGSYASGVQQDYDRLVVANQLMAIEAIVGPQKSAAERQMELMKEQIRSIDQTTTAVDATTGAIYNLNASLSTADKNAAIKSAFTSFSNDPLRVAQISRAAGWSMADVASALGVDEQAWKDHFALFDIYDFANGGQLAMLEQRYAEMKSVFGTFSDDPWRVYQISKSKGWSQADIAGAYHWDLADVRAFYDKLGIPRFADGGAFTNGIVTRPTMFNMAQMGEAGSEGILPLANVGGRLGVHASMGSNDRMVEALIAEVRMLRAKLDEVIDRQDEGNDNTERLAGQFENWTMGGRGAAKVELDVGAFP
ncbi:MAG: hypothetical protein F9K35_00655 [Burkholderiaceae bacterium]|nr:MAG: hypothetical protein F9K35_00655 [Burkholderiaceae bacterium]